MRCFLGIEIGSRLQQVRPPEGLGSVVGVGAHHPGVAIPTGATQPMVVGDAQSLQCPDDLAATVLAQPILPVGGEVFELGHQNLALLSGRARDQSHRGAGLDVTSHRGSGADDLVIGVGVDKQ